jgi:ubiquinone/menaquinone biosynthesis C-methylase UbiE
MSENHSEPNMENIYFLEEQEVVIQDFTVDGFILDIGGGGEGVIGQLKESQVVAIDPNRKELEEAAAGPIKIVMNADELQFLDNSFETVTSFFTLMYVKASQHEKVFDEIYRVLSPGGRFLIWDMEIPPCLDESKEIVAAYIDIKLPHKEIKTGYGTKWPDEKQGLSYYLKIAEKTGFQALVQERNSLVFYMELKKP